MIYTKIFHIVGNLKKKCGHHDLLLSRIAKVGKKLGVKAATFLTGLPLFMGIIHRVAAQTI